MGSASTPDQDRSPCRSHGGQAQDLGTSVSSGAISAGVAVHLSHVRRRLVMMSQAARRPPGENEGR
jgi:hypothetical protein